MKGNTIFTGRGTCPATAGCRLPRWRGIPPGCVIQSCLANPAKLLVCGGSHNNFSHLRRCVILFRLFIRERIPFHLLLSGAASLQHSAHQNASCNNSFQSFHGAHPPGKPNAIWCKNWPLNNHIHYATAGAAAWVVEITIRAQVFVILLYKVTSWKRSLISRAINPRRH